MRPGGPAGDDSVEPSGSGERRKRTDQRKRSISKQPVPECLSGQPAVAVVAERTWQARRLGYAKGHLPHAGGSDPGVLAPGVAVADGRSLAHRPAGDATAGAGLPRAVSRQPAHLAEADG